MVNIDLAITVAGSLLLLSLLASKLSDRYGVPALLLFLFVGMLAGVDGIGGIIFHNAVLTNDVGTVALAFILFAGGFGTSFKEVKPILFRGVVLSSFGVFATAIFTAIFAKMVLGMSLAEAFVLGAIISSTDAPAVFSILRSRNLGLTGQLKPILEFESGSNDPTAVFLTISALQLLTDASVSWGSLGVNFVLQMILGGILGALIGFLAGKLINILKLDYEGLYPVYGVAVVLLCYGITHSIGGNGFLASYVAGIVMGNGKYVYKAALGKFTDSISWLMQIVMFIMLGLLVNPRELLPVIYIGIGTALFIIFIARPIAVFLSLLGSKISPREQIFIAWTGLKGAVPIILGTYPLLNGYDKGQFIFNLIFFVVIVSVLLQGKTLAPVARLLKVDKISQPVPDYPLEFTKKRENQDDSTREIVIKSGSEIIGYKVKELGLPSNILILLIYREDNFITPDGKTEIKENDRLLLYGDDDKLDESEKILLKTGK